MSDHVFSRDMFEVSRPGQDSLSQTGNPLLFGNLHQLPQRFSHNLQARSEESLDNSHVHDPLRQKATSSITEDVASETCSDSRHSGVSRDSGYFSVNGGSSGSILSDPHTHWCLICQNPSAFTTCDGWKRHMKEHEITYPCLECESQANLSHAKAPTFTRKIHLVKHLEKHGILHASEKADNWRRTKKKRFYSCGFCICLFTTLLDYLNHIDYVHFRSFKTLADWDDNKVILGLLQQPVVKDAWRRILASQSIPEQPMFSWNFPVTRDLQNRLESSEDTPESLATSAWKTSMSGLRLNDKMGQDMDMDQEFLALQLKHSPKAFDDKMWHFPQEERSHELLEIGAGVLLGFCPKPRRVQDDSTEGPWRVQDDRTEGPWNPLRIDKGEIFPIKDRDPWDQLRIHEGEILPIMNLDPLNAIFSEKQKDSSDYCSTAINDNRDFADAQESGIRLGNALVMDSARRSFPLQPSSCFPNVSTTSAFPPCHASDQIVGDVIQLSQQEPPFRRSVVSVGERRESISTEEKTEGIMLVRGMEKCGICRERDVRCTHVIPSRWNAMATATTTTEYTTEHTKHRHDGDDRSKPEESAECRRDLRTHKFSHSRAGTSQAAMSSQSESTSTSPSQSPYGSFDLSIAQAKHELMVTLMEEVYAMFDSRWKVSVRTCPSSQQESSGTRAQSSKPEVPRVGKNPRKRMKDRDSSPPGDGNGKREKKDDPDTRLHHQSRLYACPFHKYDPYKYSLNGDTGAAYRSYPGHGSMSISHLKQHLRRTHHAPIQCRRCWHVMPNLQELDVHSNMEIACERREAQPEGIDQEKSDLIFSVRGINWEKIYEILFPGAPIPSPYFEAEVRLVESFAPSSPASQELEEFEEYNRRALPRLVEANLQAMVNTEMVPIEENLRRLLVDVVQRCQSTVAESFRVTRVTRSISVNSPQPPSSHANHPTPPRGEIPLTNSQVIAPITTYATSGFFQVPPHASVEAGPSCPRPSEGVDALETFPNQFTDSGYGSSQETCDCNCHADVGTDQDINDISHCGDCIIKYFDPWNPTWGT